MKFSIVKMKKEGHWLGLNRYPTRSGAPIRWVVVSLVFAFSVILGTARTTSANATEISESKVALVIDYGDGVEKHFKRLAWQDNATVWSMLQQAIKHPRGLRVKHQGRGDTLFVRAIDNVTNEGGAGRNWIYRVNNQLGDRGAGIHPVQKGDTVLWTFERYQ